MNKWFYILAIVAFILFCILWMTYQLPFVEAMDDRVSKLFYGNKFISLFHYLGNTKFVFTISAITIIVIWIFKNDYKLMLFVFINVMFAYGLYQFLKRLIERPRPDIESQLSTFSFPSGHAVMGIVYLLTIAFVFHKLSNKRSRFVWIAAIILFLLIGLSRIAQGHHYTSDIIAGWMLGYSWFIVCVLWYKSEKKPLSQ